jgi:FtsP/CotA-like multicopper oxidase with cupredoxin domain
MKNKTWFNAKETFMDRRKVLIAISLVLAIALASGVNPAHAGPGGGTYYANSPAGVQTVPLGSFNTGTALRKFVDTLPGLGPANANNLGNYIPIAIKDTTTFTNSDYYQIGLRDYTQQLHSDLPKATRLRGYIDLASGASTTPYYLGPLIIAQRDRPVRIKFTNQLGIGTAGNLFLPVDTSVMGAGMGPDGVNSYTQNRATLHLHGGATPWISDGTPHQWTVPALESTPYKKGVSTRDVPDMPATGDGEMTFFYTNQQSSRLMFYHDHAYGMTRLNVYAGEAAGYLLTDPAEDALINNGILPNICSGPSPTTFCEYRYGIPLIIQDKTFVPENIAIQDAKWDTSKWGQPGDLWFPHVYEPNQNPSDIGGASAFGRWDYGPWFWPPVIVPPDKATLPEPSIVPEGFMDTPLVNGAAYPYLPVEPKAYRFRILNACNDRMLNLQLYVSDPANPKEVRMVPAQPNAGLPANWPTDGRDGGAPDPTLIGPSMIQIGTEGGLLPAAAVLPNTPVGYDYNRRNIVVLNVLNKTLFMGPAERADVIVDFSTFAGKTIILYNDAPAPVPAFDPRNDYYTGDPDQTVNGGASTTLPGFGPNTRTIMQFRVAAAATAPVTTVSLTALNDPAAGLPAAFIASQPAPIVPQVDYPATLNAPANTYARIQDFSLTFTPIGAARPMTIPMKTKAIQELWDPYGRMNATLGVELPFTNNNIQTTIPLGYVDPVTEKLPDGQVQLWKITHNGVDTHAIHVHLFNAQVINRVGWDGQIRPPDPNELGWKETIRMHPLEDIIIALQPKSQTLPTAWNSGAGPGTLPDSVRSPDVTSLPTSTVSVINPVDGNALLISNATTTFGWEYVWHCHLLGHEENDMMRPIVFLVPTAVPADPTLMTAMTVTAVLPATTGNEVQLGWTYTPKADPNVEIGFRIERCSGPGCSSFAPITNVYSDVTTYIDAMVDSNTSYNYRVFAYNAKGDSLLSAGTGTIVTPSWTLASGVTLTTDLASPQPAGTPVLFTANGQGSTVAYQYRFWLSTNGTGTTIVQDYSVNPSWSLPVSTVAGTYTVTADVRTSGSTTVPDRSASLDYVLTGYPRMVSVSIIGSGTVVPSPQTVSNGATASFTVTPDLYYHVASVTGCGGILSGSTYTTAPITATCVVTATFALPDGNLGYGVTMNDALRALMIASGIVTPTVSDLQHGDVAPLVNGKPQPDGTIDIGDVLVILRKIVGSVSW